MEEENKLKVQLLTYRRPLPKRSIIEYRPRTQAVRQADLPQQIRASSMGQFDTLPVEITHSILSLLDIQSLENMMSINSHCEASVKSLPAYTDMIVHASGTVEALISTGLIGKFSVGRLHAALRTDRCEGCAEFGAFLFLPTCSRRCYSCLCNDRRLRVTSVSGAKALFGLTKGDLQQLSILGSTPQMYSREAQPSQRRLCFVSVEEARALGIARFGDEDGIKDFVEATHEAKSVVFEQQLELWKEAGDGQVKKPHRPRSLWLNTRFPWGIASSRIPFFNVGDQSVQWGVSCRGCAEDEENSQDNYDQKKAMGLFARKDRYFGVQEFLDHYEECDAAKRVWKEEKEHIAAIESTFFQMDFLGEL